MAFRLSANSIKNRAGVDPRLVEISDLAIKLTNVDFGHGPHSGLRTEEEQAKLFTKGLSKCDGRVNRSYHQTGKALDFYAFVDGKASWHEPHLGAVALAFMQAASLLGHGVRWGGFWLSKNPKIVDGVPYGWDCPHIELED